MICGSGTCECAFESSSLVIGRSGNVVTLETAGPAVVTTSAAVTTPFLGQTIYETATGRLKVHDGTNWVIYGGVMPEISMWHGTAVAQTFTTGVLANIALSAAGTIEVVDTDSFRSGAATQYTIPAGLGGDYDVKGMMGWSSPGATGAFYLRLNIGNNAGMNEIAIVDAAQGGPNGGAPLTQQNVAQVRLRAGATVALGGFHNSGINQSINQWSFSLRMARHVPSLV